MSQRAVVWPIISQHAEEAAFLWLLRNAAVSEPHYSLKDCAELDDRVEAHIDGLRIAGNEGWKICAEALAYEEPGEVFVAAVLALEAQDRQRLDQVTEMASGVPETFSAMVSALGWVSAVCSHHWMLALLQSQSPIHRRLGIAGFAVNRVDPRDALTHALGDDDPTTRARALRAVGELKRHDLLSSVTAFLNTDHMASRFWAAWSAVLLAKEDKLGPLKTFVNIDSSGGFARRALQLGLRAMPQSDAHNWLKGLAHEEARLRDVLIGCGVTGDPRYIPWLIKNMKNPEHARVAGESFSMITGVDLAYEDLESDRPEGFEVGPTEDPADENVAMDQDEDLPWPDPDKLEDWWRANRSYYKIGTRYLCGKPITVNQCLKVLRDGFQRQRNAAALELALLDPGEPLFPTHAPGFRQQARLGLKHE